MMELAGMLKEVGKGNGESLEELVAKFCIKVGVREEVANHYIDLFTKSKLLMFQHGQETWEYNEQVEVEIFGTKL